jgi:hypothetical protein
MFPPGLQALTEESEFDPKLLQTAVDLLNASHAYAAADSLAALLAAAVARTSTGRHSQHPKRQRTSPGAAAADAPASGVPASSDAAAAEDMETDGELTPEAVEAEVLQLVGAWAAVVGDGPSSYEEAEQQYVAVLEPLSVGVFDAAAAGAFNRQFSAMAAQPEGMRVEGCSKVYLQCKLSQSACKLPLQHNVRAGCLLGHFYSRTGVLLCRWYQASSLVWLWIRHAAVLYSPIWCIDVLPPQRVCCSGICLLCICR